MTSAGNQADAHWVPPRHEPEPVVLDLVDPIRPDRRLWGGGGEAWFYEARPVSGQALTQTLERHAANLGSRSRESNQFKTEGAGLGKGRRPMAKKAARGRKQDRALVAGKQDYELRYEAKKTGKSKAKVKRAVKKAGPSRKKVERALGR
jgi:hypothetical protein